MYTVYAIFNERHNKIYIGQTKDLETRLKLHNDKAFKNNYTAKFDGVWQIIYKEDKNNRREALLREKQLKSYQGRKFVKQFIPRWRNGSAVGC